SRGHLGVRVGLDVVGQIIDIVRGLGLVRSPIGGLGRGRRRFRGRGLGRGRLFGGRGRSGLALIGPRAPREGESGGDGQCHDSGARYHASRVPGLFGRAERDERGGG